jgi:hypothetical protein
VDHKNRNGRNNIRSNIRGCTYAENQQNCSLQSSNISGYSGVSWHKLSQKWLTLVSFNGKRHFLGYFIDKDEAIEVVKQFRIKHCPFSSEAMEEVKNRNR